ncbi:MAG: DUF4442 domain-containing protein [Saprospiraceae bacterium]
MQYNNRLNRTLKKLDSVPSFLRHWLRNRAIGGVVPFVGTAGIEFKKMTCEELIIEIPNKKKIQNHISQVHAAASVLLAETASGMVVGMNVPDDKLPLMKKLSAKYIKRSQGAQRAVATLNPQQIEQIRTSEKGDVTVPVKLTDSTGEEVVIVEMEWAWITKK